MIIQLKKIGIPDENGVIYTSDCFSDMIKSSRTQPIAGKIGMDGLAPLGKIVPPSYLSHTFMNLQEKRILGDDWLVGELIILFCPQGEELRNLILNNRVGFLMAGEIHVTPIPGTDRVFVDNCKLNSINAVKLEPVE